MDGVRRRMSEVACEDFNFLESKGGGLVLNTAAILIKKKALMGVGLFEPTLTRSEDSDLTQSPIAKRLLLGKCSRGKGKGHKV